MLFLQCARCGNRNTLWEYALTAETLERLKTSGVPSFLTEQLEASDRVFDRG